MILYFKIFNNLLIYNNSNYNNYNIYFNKFYEKDEEQDLYLNNYKIKYNEIIKNIINSNNELHIIHNINNDDEGIVYENIMFKKGTYYKIKIMGIKTNNNIDVTLYLIHPDHETINSNNFLNNNNGLFFNEDNIIDNINEFKLKNKLYEVIINTTDWKTDRYYFK